MVATFQPGRRLHALVAALLLSPGLMLLAAAAGPPDPDHDLLSVGVRADATKVYVDVAVAGVIPRPVSGQDEIRLAFGIIAPITASAGVPANRSYFVSYGTSSTPIDYYLWNSVAGRGFLGTVLNPQPANGTSSTTFTLDRSTLLTLTNEGAPPGSVLTGLTVTTVVAGAVVDRLVAPDFTLPAGLPGDAENLHLQAEGSGLFVRRFLDPAAPLAGTPRADPVAAGGNAPVRFRGPLIPRPLQLQDATATLYFSFTSTTPLLAANVINLKVNLLAPDGTVSVIGQRSDISAGGSGNVFSTPGAPQRVVWPITFTRTAIPAGSALEVEVVAQGILGLGDNGPALLLYGSPQFDSFLSVRATAGPAPLVPISDPALGTISMSARGVSGALAPQRPGGSEPQASLAATEENTQAVWTSEPLVQELQINAARAEVWVSSVTSSPALALNFLDAKLYSVEGATATLLARRVEYTTSQNPNVFTVPVTPQLFSWPLNVSQRVVPVGAQLKLVITADVLQGSVPGAALVWSNASTADTRVLISTAAVQASAAPSQAMPGEEIAFAGVLRGGLAPYTYQFKFGDGQETAPAMSSGGAVSALHAYAAEGTYTAALVATDSAGAAGGALVTVSITTTSTPTILTAVRANPFLADLGSAQVTWTSNVPGDSRVEYGLAPDALAFNASGPGSVLRHMVNLSGLAGATTYYYRVASNGVNSDTSSFVTPGDFSGDSHVVVALMDTGINPYHHLFRRSAMTAHPATYLTGYPAASEALDLHFDEATYGAAVAADAETWATVKENTLYWIPGTNIVGAIDKGAASFINAAPDSRRILDDDNHGTWTAGTVTLANPEVLLVIIESSANDALGWAASQPWIDVISMSFSGVGTPQLGFDAAASQAVLNGKLLVASAGNEPYPEIVETPTGWPQVISVGGADAAARGETLLASKLPDVVSNFTVGGLPGSTSLTGTATVSGTSFSTPNVAGTLSKVVLALRREARQTVEDTRQGLVHGFVGGAGPLADGVLTNGELRDAMNLTAEWWGVLDYDPAAGLDAISSIDPEIPVAPGAPWIQMGWGYMGPTLADNLFHVARGDYVPHKPAEARLYLETIYRLRVEYYTSVFARQAQVASLAPLDGALDVVDAPGLESHVVPVGPFETAHPYLAGTDTNYTVNVPGARAVSVHFENFSVETGFDTVTLLDRSGNTWAVLSLEGQASFWSPYVPGDTVILHFVSDGGEERYGFEVREADAFFPPPETSASCVGVCDLNDGWVHVIRPLDAGGEADGMLLAAPDGNGDYYFDQEMWATAANSPATRLPIGSPAAGFLYAGLAFNALSGAAANAPSSQGPEGIGEAFVISGPSDQAAQVIHHAQGDTLRWRIPSSALEAHGLMTQGPGGVRLLQPSAVYGFVFYKPRFENQDGDANPANAYSSGAGLARTDHAARDVTACRNATAAGEATSFCPESGGFASAAKNALFPQNDGGSGAGTFAAERARGADALDYAFTPVMGVS